MKITPRLTTESIEFVMKFLGEPSKTGEPIYWGTYNISLPLEDKKGENMIEEIKKACGSKSLRIICAPPKNKKPQITKDAFNLLKSAKIEVKYYQKMEEGQHHAKYLIFKNKALFGSFNFSYRSLNENMESLVYLEGDEIQCMYNEISGKWEEHVFDEVDPDKLEKQKFFKKEPKTFTLISVDIKSIYNAVYKKLYEYQKEVFNEILHRDYQIDILCLPTGLGKTFIAIAWLLKQGESKGNKTKMLYITPTPTIKNTIKDTCINKIKIPEIVDAIHIKTAKEFVDDSFCEYCAAIFDEVHRWNPKRRESSYSLARKKLKENGVKILGISATPFRQPVYDQQNFYREFCESTHTILNKYTVMHAIEEKWLTRPEWKIISESCDILSDYIPENGKYSEGTLMREWWSPLKTDNNLIDTIVGEIKSNKLKKGLICMPPAKEEFDNIVEDLREKLSSYGEILDIRSKNCSNPWPVIQKFRSSKNPIFLASINRASEGIDVPEIDSLFMLRMPLSDSLAIQIIGRGLRRYENEHEKKFYVFDAVGYKKRLELIPVWGISYLSNLQPSTVNVTTGIDSRIDMLIKLTIECMYDTDYGYNFFLRHHVEKLLSAKDFDQLVIEGLSGKLKKDFGSKIKIKVYGTNTERDKKILSNLPKTAKSAKILKDFIESNKEDFVYRYISNIDEHKLLTFAKENIGHLSLEDLIDYFLKNASSEMQKYLLNDIFDYDDDYIKEIKNNKKYKSELINYLDKAVIFNSPS